MWDTAWRSRYVSKTKMELVRFNMALLSLVFAAIFAVTAVLMIVASDRQTQMSLNAALHFPEAASTATSHGDYPRDVR